MPKYVNRIAQSIVLKVYTDKKHPRVRVFLKTEDREDGQVEEILSKQEIAEFLNKFANRGKHKTAISKNVEQGIIKDIEGIHRENDRYLYKAPDLSAERQYNKLFESEQGIQFDLNNCMSDSISKIVQLGAANFTLEEVCRVMELAVNHYSYDMYIKNFADYCEVHIELRNATLISKKAEKLYETTERTNSKIIDISVDKGMNKLLLTPASL